VIIPIGHDRSELRRQPWVSYGVILLCTAVFLGMDTSAPDPAQERKAALREAAAYWREHAYLVADPAVRTEVAYDVMPNERAQYLEVLRDRATPMGLLPPPEELAAAQAELDRLTERALGRGAGATLAADHPFYRFGLVPAEPSASGFLTHIFVHAGWGHLIGNLFLLFLLAPAIEDRYGRPLFAALFLAAGIFGAALHAGLSHDPSLPLIGASGAIAGVLGAFLVRYGAAQIRFAYLFFVGLRFYRGTFDAPAWLVAPLWFAGELVKAWVVTSAELGSGVAYWAHVGGFAAGAAGALAISRLRVEERWLHSALESKVRVAQSSPGLEQAQSAREAGDLERAFALLGEEVARNPRDPDAALAYWDVAVGLQRPEAAATAAGRVVRYHAAQGHLDVAAQLWLDLVQIVPAARVEPATLVKLVPALRALGRADAAREALRHALDPANPGLSPGLALRLVEETRADDPEIALAAARRALESPDLHEAKRERMRALVAELGAAAAARPPEPARPAAPAPETAPAARELPLATELEPEPAPETARDLPLAALDPAARFAGAKRVEVAPLRIEGEHLHLRAEGGRTTRLALARVQAIAVAAVGGEGARRVLVIDLCLNWRSLDEELLHVVRMRSDRFDPRVLVTGTSAMEALRAFLAELFELTGAAPLPSPEAARGRPFAVYDSLAAYEREALGIADA
jgi:membrane associated rhomboid family serine protease